PIGERWLAISVASVVGGAGFTFTVMPILAFISAAVVFRGRLIRTREMDKVGTNSTLIVDQLDLLGLRRSFFMRWDWIEPSLLRGVEAIILISIFAYQDLLGIPAFIILFSIFFHHYDNLYRALQGEQKPEWLSALGFFLGGRVLLIGIAALAGWSLTYFAWYFSLLFLGVSSLQWVMTHRVKGSKR
ncbi:MAG: hypothetical protein EBZ85_02890, partial [Actinobacteria bacterium]|nr:hypothetical protein [Actinomycetota bacterium]